METINSCRICKNKDIKKFFDLGGQPLANALPKSKEESEKLYSLSLSWCKECNLVQLNETIDPKELFSEYVWVTATSKVAKDYSEIFFTELTKRSSGQGYVLEIASNDGTFLKPFINKGYKVLGVDPAENIAKMAQADNIPTECAFFGKAEAENIIREFGKAQIIFARNVLPHVANTRDFVEGLAICLNEGGTLAIEAHYAKEILKELHYYSIYHEHLCFFTLKTLERLLNDYGLYIFDISESPISGGSMVVYAKKEKGIESEKLKTFRENEKLAGVNDFEKWQEFAKKATEHRDSLLDIIKKNARLGVLVGYGSSARSSTMLNFAEVNSNLISFIADANPLKQGRFAAGTRIPIISPKEMVARNPRAVIVLAWNFADEITKILREDLNYKGKIIIPLPMLREV
jgi:2-polyprenyl-3-methyl-5-hydroxy-6-metoxy-1,4-benzoquinol methylase